MRAKNLFVSGAALAAVAALGPLGVANVSTSAAPAPVRTVAAAVTDATIADASAAYITECRWVWKDVSPRWWPGTDYRLVQVCYQRPN